MFSDKAGDFIGVGYHYGIKIGDTIYDNMTLGGMNFDSWLKDLGIGMISPDEINYSVVTEILNF